MSAEEAREYRWLKKNFKDVYQSTNQFVAVALTNGYKLTQKEANPDPNASSGTPRFARQAFRGRILDGAVPSPHSFLKDPCNLDDTISPAYTTALILQHTEFLVLEDNFKSTFKGNISVNDKVNVYLDPGPDDADFDLERGWAIGTHEGSRHSNTRGKKAIDCTSLKDIMANAPAYIPGLGATQGLGTFSSGADCDLGRTSTSNDNPEVLYVGDSQMVGNLGNALIEKGGDGNILAKGGTNPGFWTDEGQAGFVGSDTSAKCSGADQLRAELAKNPTKIIISLGDNGPWGHEDLIALIQEEAPDADVIWSGKSPPIYMGGTPEDINRAESAGFGYLTTEPGWTSAYDTGAGWNKELKAAVEAQGWTFYDPYEFEGYAGGGYGDTRSGYECNGCDGIHVQADPAAAYAASLDL